MTRKTHREAKSSCPIACTLDLLGDRWTLLVIRDLLLGKTQFGDFLESPESISTNILTDRLNRLHEYGVVKKRLYQRNPERHEYTLTRKGRDLGRIVVEMVRWGEANIAGTRAFEKFDRTLLDR